jgi:outer membrane protein assembly factor BamB
VVALCWIAVCGPMDPAAVQAQVAVKADPSPAAEGTETQKRAFNLPSLPGDVSEALEDFGRHSKRGAWERAFKSLQKMQEANPNGMVPSSEGFLLSARARLWEALAALPPEGRDAYRIFFDPEAKKLIAEAQGQAEAEKLNKVFSAYFATSVGDQAADRLGDLLFEQGELTKAADCWRAVLQYCPESALPRVRLLTKSAIALARSGRWDEFRVIERTVREKHSGERVTLGGQEVDAGKLLAELAAARKPSPEGLAANSASEFEAAEIELADQAEPLWQFRYFSETTAKMIANAGQDWGGRATVTTMVPPAIVDGSHVLVNLVGHNFCLDLETGKLLWRTAKFHDLGQKFQQNRVFVFPEQFGITAAASRVFCVTPNAQEVGNQNSVFRLTSLNPADGKPVWSSESVNELKSWSFCGQPVATADRLFACGFTQQKPTDLHLVAVQAETGKLLWTALLGTHQVDQRQMYYMRTAQPSLLLHKGNAYVDTHSGALVEVNADTGTMNWGFQYEADVPDTQNWWSYRQTQSLLTVAPPIAIGDTLYFKGMRSQRLYALQLSGPKILWQRPVAKSAMLMAIDGDRILLTGEETESLRLENRALQWSSRVPVGTSMIRPAVTRNRVYQFTPRGIFELDKAAGDVVRTFRGADLGSLGGSVFLTRQAIVTVSNVAVTAYPIRSDKPIGQPTIEKSSDEEESEGGS